MFEIFKLGSCFDYLKLFLLRSNPFDPFLYLIQHIYIALFRSFPYSSIILISAIISILLTQRNYFFHIGIFILPSLSPPLAIVNLVFGIFACNEYWKVLLFVFSLINFLTFDEGIAWNWINIVTAGVYLMIIYTRLVFNQVEENRKYFAGFCCLAVVYGINTLFEMLGMGRREYWEVYVVLGGLGGLAGNSIIKTRLCGLVNSTIENLTSGSEIVNFIEMVRIRAKENPIGLYETHTKNCKHADCFCKI